MRWGFRAERVDGNAEFSQAAHVMTDQALPLAFIGRWLIGFLIGNAGRERPVDDDRKSMRHTN